MVDGFSGSGLIALNDHLRGMFAKVFFVANEVILGVPLADFSFLPNGMVSCYSTYRFIHDTLLLFETVYLHSIDINIVWIWGMRTGVNALNVCYTQHIYTQGLHAIISFCLLSVNQILLIISTHIHFSYVTTVSISLN